MKNRVLAILLAGAMVATLAACGSSQSTGGDTQEEQSAEDTTADTAADSEADAEESAQDGTTIGTVNPFSEVSEEEFVKSVGVSLKAPEDAQDVTYLVYTADGYMDLLGEMQFTLDGVEYFERVLPTGKLSMDEFTDDEVTEFTGLNYAWTDTADAEVSYCSAKVYSCEGQDPASVVVWLDTVPGIAYCLGTHGEQVVKADDLVALADEIFEPAQGDV